MSDLQKWKDFSFIHFHPVASFNNGHKLIFKLQLGQKVIPLFSTL